MNGAEALVRTLIDAGIDTCFANPGTSEMPLLAAIDRVGGMHGVLCLFEGVATGAADGFARIADRPASALLHLGPGLGNGLANLHNARRARTPLVNIVGDHATYHKQFDSPLESDIDAVAATVSQWCRRVPDAAGMGDAAAHVVRAATSTPGGVATLIVPADACWSDGGAPADPAPPDAARPADPDTVAAVARALASGEPVAMLLGGRAGRADTLRDAGRIAAATGAQVLTATSVPRLERGAGVPEFERLQYRAETAAAQLAPYRHLVLVDAARPVAFFAYPDHPSDLVPPGCTVHTLCRSDDDVPAALAELADVVASRHEATPAAHRRPDLPTGPLTPATVAAALGALLPEGAIVVDESNTAGGAAGAATAGAPRHDWLRLTGGAIGIGLPLALGAALAAPDRTTIAFQADGSALYTLQALWSMARERANVVTILLNNGSYAILRAELARTGAAIGPTALDMLDLTRPTIDYVKIAEGFGVDAVRATTADELVVALADALGRPGPRLIDVAL